MGQIVNKTYINNQALASADFAGSWIPVNSVTGVSIGSAWTGSINGTLKLQVTNDPNNLALLPPLDYPGSQYPVSGAGNWGWDITSLHSGFIRLYFVFSSGTGTLNANYTLKSGPQGWGPTP